MILVLPVRIHFVSSVSKTGNRSLKTRPFAEQTLKSAVIRRAVTGHTLAAISRHQHFAVSTQGRERLWRLFSTLGERSERGGKSRNSRAVRQQHSQAKCLKKAKQLE